MDSLSCPIFYFQGIREWVVREEKYIYLLATFFTLHHLPQYDHTVPIVSTTKSPSLKQMRYMGYETIRLVLVCHLGIKILTRKNLALVSCIFIFLKIKRTPLGAVVWLVACILEDAGSSHVNSLSMYMWFRLPAIRSTQVAACGTGTPFLSSYYEVNAIQKFLF